jgi:hypothetical protein
MTEPQPLARYSLATVATPFAGRYLGQLCKHFAHKITVDHQPTTTPPRGVAHFLWGDCVMEAQADHLAITTFANDAQAGQRIEAVVDDHLRRFAWREEITIDWQRDL